jgi:hypothetical protein
MVEVTDHFTYTTLFLMDALSLQGDATDKDGQTTVNAQGPSFAET